MLHCAEIAYGVRKCSAKNRVSVALSTANPPHTHRTLSVPINMIVDDRFIIWLLLKMTFVLMVGRVL